jgi:hypothetical protein
MKFRVFVGVLVWTALITAAHVQLNIGWARLGEHVRVLLGSQRRTLEVGFIPVT